MSVKMYIVLCFRVKSSKHLAHDALSIFELRQFEGFASDNQRIDV